MRFWDASAVVPLCVEEPGTLAIDRELARDPEMVVWWATPVECASALNRLAREAVFDPDATTAALSVLGRLERAWYEVMPSGGLREVAKQLLRAHDLRAADALQLAAALEWSGRPASGELLSLDRRLSTAAVREGFSVPDALRGLESS